MVKRFPAHLCCLNENAEVFLCALLPDIFVQIPRAERALAGILRQSRGSGYQFIFLLRIRKADRRCSASFYFISFFSPLPHDILDGQILNIQSLERCGDLVSAVAEHAKRRRRIGELVSAGGAAGA